MWKNDLIQRHSQTRVPERSNGSALRADGITFAGSNPASCINKFNNKLKNNLKK